jgi:hypothetical protein
MGVSGHDRRPRGRRAVLVLVAGALAGLPAIAGAGVVKDNLYDVHTHSPTEAWAVGAFGSIYHTTDGGKVWEPQPSGTDEPLFGVEFADATRGWAVGKSSLILHTADGGRSWTAQKSAIPPDKHLFNVAALDARTAWVVGDWGAIATTRDGGATWEDRSLAEDVVLYDVSFPDPGHGYVAGEFGTLLATADGGRTWEKRAVPTDKTFFGVCFVTPETGWVVGIDGIILRTGDGGRTWEVQRGRAQMEALEEVGFLESLKNPGLYDVQVLGRFGAVVGDTGTLLTTDDGGASWTRRELAEGKELAWMRGVSLVAGARGFAVGAKGFTALLDGDRVALPAVP